jgi:hypothetical protein
MYQIIFNYSLKFYRRLPMRYGLFTVLFLLILLLNPGCSTSPGIVDDTPAEVKKFFGERITGIIKESVSAASFRLKPEKTKDDKVKNIHGFPVVSEGPGLTETQIASLKRILLDEKTYDFKYSKRAFVFPEYAVILKNGNDSVAVLIDFYRKEFLFVNENRELVEDFDNAEKQLKMLLDDIFK